MTDGVKFECYLNLVPGALFWFAPLQRNRTRSPGRKVRASASLMLGPEPTSLVALHMSAFDPKRAHGKISCRNRSCAEPKLAKRQCHRRCHIRYKFVTSRIEFVPMTGATIVVEFELAKDD